MTPFITILNKCNCKNYINQNVVQSRIENSFPLIRSILPKGLPHFWISYEALTLLCQRNCNRSRGRYRNLLNVHDDFFGKKIHHRCLKGLKAL